MKYFKLVYMCILGWEWPQCIAVDGGWSEWGKWDTTCSVTCGVGILRRYRKCNNPPPSLNGEKCKGDAVDYMPCEGGPDCAVDGQWTPWSSWLCARTCGVHVTGIRNRLCANPEPANGGKDCVGESQQVGNCNLKPCPLPPIKLPEETLDEIENSMRERHYNFEKDAGATVRIPCDTSKPKFLLRNYIPFEKEKLSFTWTKNGKTIDTTSTTTVTLDDNDLVISNIQPEQNGVFACHMTYDLRLNIIISIASVTARTNEVLKTVRAPEPLEMTCNAGELEDAFNPATLQWVLNGNVLFRFPSELPSERNVFVVEPTKPEYTGEWKCQILDLKRAHPVVWTTNVVNVKVLRPYGKVTLLFRDPVLGGGILTCIIVIIVVAFAFAKYLKWKTEKKLEKMETKNIHEEEHSEEMETLLPDEKNT